MAILTSSSLRLPLVAPIQTAFQSFRYPSPPPSRTARICRSSSSASSRMEGVAEGKRLMDFPYVTAPYRDLMVELVSAVETRLDSYLLPCTLPPDVQSYHNLSGTAHASLHIRSARKPSPIDFILGSWTHCELPSGAFNSLSLSAYLSPSTDAPNFLFEIYQISPTSLILVHDLLPRKDLALHPDYLQTFYEDTKLIERRQLLEKIPEVRPYNAKLYFRCITSPTAIMICIDTDTGRTEHMEEIVRDQVSPIAKEVLGIWIDRCAFGGKETGKTQREFLAKRDQTIRRKVLELDLESNLPRMFGEDVAARVIGAIREAYGV